MIGRCASLRSGPGRADSDRLARAGAGAARPPADRSANNAWTPRLSRRVVSAGVHSRTRLRLPFGNRDAQPLMAHATCCILHAARHVLGASAAGGSIEIGPKVLIALIIAALLSGCCRFGPAPPALVAWY
jgi:hypothetical protein